MKEILKNRLLSANARDESVLIAKECVDNPKVLKSLIKFFEEGNYRVNQRASWVLALLAEKSPQCLMIYESQFIASLNDDSSEALLRNVFRIWTHTGISEENAGRVFDLCIKYLTQVSPIAVKAHAMEVATQIAQPYRELRMELKPIIQLVLEREGPNSAGIRSMARKVLKKL